MLFFFDIFHNGELHLDEDGQDFPTLEHANAHLINALRELVRMDEDPLDRAGGPDAVIDITDRGRVRQIVAIATS